MNRQLLSTSLILVLILFVAGIVAYWAWPQQSNIPTGVAVSTSTPSSTSAPASVPNPAIKKTPAPIKTTTPPRVSGDTMMASAKGGIIPFTVTFTLNLNSDRLCSGNAYTVAFGDNTEKNIDIPQEQCSKPLTTVLYHQYERAGVFTAALFTRLIGGSRGANLSQTTITAKNPTTTVGTTKWGTFSASTVSGAAPLNVDFTLSVADNIGSSGINYTISFGNGETSTFPQTASPSLSHVFDAQGTYIVTVTRRTECAADVCSGSSTPIGTITITVF